jgi:GDP-L-fucose synthase
LLVKELTEFKGEIIFNSEKPDGTPKKLMDSARINMLGWNARIPLIEGIRNVYLDADKTQWV